MKFSDRIGITQVKNTIQLESIDTDLRNGLYNCLKVGFLDNMDSDSLDYVTLSPRKSFIFELWSSFYKEPVDNITDEKQIIEIQNAVDKSESNPELKGVNIHLKSALHKLSDKRNPDYRNSIKESISAVESFSQIISGDKKAELGKALKIIKEKIGLHSALEQGFIKIYGYTSDGDGIRHSLTEESTVDIEDAIYMLISCSAFINYLPVKSNKAGISF